jgi:hypothetical protein
MRSVTEHQIQPQYPPFLIFLMLDPEGVVNRRGKPSYPRSVKASMGLKLQRGLKAVPQLVRVPRPVTDAPLCSLVVVGDVDGGEVVEPRRSISTTGSHKTVLQMGHDALADADVMLQPELEAGVMLINTRSATRRHPGGTPTARVLDHRRQGTMDLRRQGTVERVRRSRWVGGGDGSAGGRREWLGGGRRRHKS